MKTKPKKRPVVTYEVQRRSGGVWVGVIEFRYADNAKGFLEAMCWKTARIVRVTREVFDE